jgi:carboxyl-terminal processing protease
LNFVRRLVAMCFSLSVLVIVLGGAAFTAQHYMPKPPQVNVVFSTPAPPAALGVPVVGKIMDLLERNYIHPVNDQMLGQSAVKTLKLYLKQQKVDASKIPDLPKGLDRDQTLAAIKADLDQAKELVKGKVTDEKLLYASLQGMTIALDDPYTIVFQPSDFSHFEEQMNGGNFGGIGTYLELDREHKNRLIVTEPIEGTPAFDAGIKEGDYIAKIDGKDTAGLDIETAAGRIRGPQGSSVVLTIVHPHTETPVQISVKRALIHVRSVSSKMLDHHIGYIRLRVFGESTDTEFADELAKVQEHGAKSLIIDLRNNGGGYVNAALEICSHFLKKGQRIVSVVNPRTGRNEPHDCAGTKVLIQEPMVLLVNRYSASASEITAGCLKDHHIAKLIGEKTFGKGSVQQLEQLGDGGALKYTVAHYLTPDGRDIHKKGIPADIDVKVSPSDKGDKVLSVAEKTLEGEMARH